MDELFTSPLLRKSNQSTLMNIHEQNNGYLLCWAALEASPNGFDFVIEILNGRNYPLQPCSTEHDG